MNYEGEKFLLKLYKDLGKEDKVLLAEKRSGTNSATKYEALNKYLKRLERQEKVFDGEHKELEKYLKNRYFDKYVIKEEDIPDSYWKHQEQVALELGHGHVTLSNYEKYQMAKKITKDQKDSLEKWIDYLIKENRAYPMWARYWAFQGMLKLGSFNKETSSFKKRSSGTTAKFIDLNPEALSKSIDTVLSYVNKEIIDDKELEKLIESGNFGKVYAYNLQQVLEAEKSIEKEKEKSIDGKWILFEGQKDAKKVTESLEGKGTGWCIAGFSAASGYLKNGRLHIYYTKDKNNNYTVPRICIREEQNFYNKEYNIREIRGINQDQEMESEMLEVLDKKLDEFDDKKEYTKKSKDLKKLTEAYNKMKSNKKLNKSEVLFIYEIKDKIKTFGWSRDPRIQELKDSRNLIEDIDKYKELDEVYGKSFPSKKIREKLSKKEQLSEDDIKDIYGLNLDVSEIDFISVFDEYCENTKNFINIFLKNRDANADMEIIFNDKRFENNNYPELEYLKALGMPQLLFDNQARLNNYAIKQIKYYLNIYQKTKNHEDLTDEELEYLYNLPNKRLSSLEQNFNRIKIVFPGPDKTFKKIIESRWIEDDLERLFKNQTEIENAIYPSLENAYPLINIEKVNGSLDLRGLEDPVGVHHIEEIRGDLVVKNTTTLEYFISLKKLGGRLIINNYGPENIAMSFTSEACLKFIKENKFNRLPTQETLILESIFGTKRNDVYYHDYIKTLEKLYKKEKTGRKR